MENSEWRKDLEKDYKETRKCLLCRLKYGTDKIGKDESGICPKCSYKGRMKSIGEGRWGDE